MRRTAPKTGWRAWAPLALAFTLCAALGHLPPDASLRDIKRAGLFRVCVPAVASPWITTDPTRPGFDIEVLRVVAQRMDLGMTPVAVSEMDNGINPRSWGLTRARCDMIAGGLAITGVTRSFLDAGPVWGTAGLVLFSADGAPLEGQDGTVGIYLVGTGTDRLALGRLLRRAGRAAQVFDHPEALADALASGQIEAAIAPPDLEVTTPGIEISDLPAPFEAGGAGPGFWKGDRSFSEEVRRILRRMEAQGTLSTLRQAYGIASPTE
ncbi:ABC transporter substrate-binding protein [Salipiger sp. IMCC34102]|uniref:substrate-binding periplasmic protein n=1 Tax=Salipiger sp. IMCC34102 TaxID=2510647 RepID=UPI0013EB184D|nr:transporter substrate-binding domain-containing protein [Salipiger sp. IMCC34102]